MRARAAPTAGHRAETGGPRDRRCARSTGTGRRRVAGRRRRARGSNLASCVVTPLDAVAIAAAGLAAGAINTIVGSGSLITFPTLLAVGYSPVVANVPTTIGPL